MPHFRSFIRPSLPLALALSACVYDAGQSAHEEGASEAGRLALPLTVTYRNKTYALAGTFDLVGPETIRTVVTPAEAVTNPELRLTPRVGSYNLTLSAWTLSEVTVAGNSTPVANARLLMATIPFEIQVNETAYVTFAFVVPGGEIVFARGTLVVRVGVVSGLPPGSGCTADTHCESFVCGQDGVCSEPSCTDGILNGDETSPDCGPSCSCTEDPNANATACSTAQAASCPPGGTCRLIAGVPWCSVPGVGEGIPCGPDLTCPAGLACNLTTTLCQ